MKRGSVAGFQVWFQPSRGFFFRIDEGPNNVETVARATVLNGEWHHVAVGRNKTEHFLYVDGALDSTTPDTTLADLTEAISFDIGNESSVPTIAFRGLLDEIRVYDRALSAQEIQDQFRLKTLFRRADVDSDSTRNITDAVALLNHLFLGQPSPPCQDAADANDDGGLDISDAITILAYLFLGDSTLPDPADHCGDDPTPDGLGCESFPACA
jgi:hypothetical protein